METTIVTVNAEEYGIQENKAKEISAMFKPMLDKMVELEEQFNEVITLPMSPETYAKARALRLEYKNTRTGTAKIHKDLKAFYLQGGRFVDGWKNAQKMASQGAEDKLAAIENHEAIEKQKQIEALQEKRSKALNKYDIDPIPGNLGEMDKVTWDSYLTGTKVNYDKKKKEEKDAEELRAKLQKQETLHRERATALAPYSNTIENYSSINWGEKDEKEYKTILDKAMADHVAKLKEDERIRKENERLLAEAQEKERIRKEEEDKRRAKDLKLEKERAAQREAIRKEAEAKLEKERKAKEKAEADLKAIADEKVRLKQAEEDRIEAELSKGDESKWIDLIADLKHIAQKYTFKSEKNQHTYDNVGVLVGKIITYIPV